jgi:hypothetical protein
MTRKRANIMLIGQQPGEEGRALKYRPEFCDAVRLMANEGMFPEEWCAQIGVTMSTLFNWANTYPDFERAVSEAWHILNAHWTKKAREIVSRPALWSDLKATVFLEILRKRFPETWGKNARNTQETFENRRTEMDEEAGRSSSPLFDQDSIRRAATEDIERRIAELEARREAMKDRKP